MFIKLIDLNKNLAGFTAEEALVVDALDDVAAPVLIITDYADSIFGVEALNASLDQVKSVLEIKLRENGMIDGFSEVIVHKVSRVSGFSVVLYTAIQVDTYLAYGRASAMHKEPCHYMALAYSLYCYGAAMPEENVAVVLQHGRCLDFVLINKGDAVGAERLLVFERDTDGDNMIAQLLQGFASAVKRGAILPTKVVWLLHDSIAAETESWFVEFQQQADFCSVEFTDSQPFYGEETLGSSSAIALFNTLTIKNTVTRSDLRLDLLSDRMMPWLSGLFVIICSALLIWNAVVYVQKGNIEQTVSQLEASPEFARIAQLRQDMQTADAERSPLIKASAEFAADLQKTRVRDVRRVMMDIRSSLSELVKIRRVSVVTHEGDTPTIIVEGQGIEFPGAVRGEELLSEALRNKGYDVTDRTLAIKKNDNGFSFLLKWREIL
jgi:hypothetical protein